MRYRGVDFIQIYLEQVLRGQEFFLKKFSHVSIDSDIFTILKWII